MTFEQPKHYDNKIIELTKEFIDPNHANNYRLRNKYIYIYIYIVIMEILSLNHQQRNGMKVWKRSWRME